MRQTFPPTAGSKSPNNACEDNRLVKLFKKKCSGGRSARQDLQGRRRQVEIVVDPLSSGSYRAVVAERGGHRGDDLRLPARCSGAQSSTRQGRLSPPIAPNARRLA